MFEYLIAIEHAMIVVCIKHLQIAIVKNKCISVLIGRTVNTISIKYSLCNDVLL